MLQEPVRAVQLLLCLVVGDIESNLSEIGLGLDKAELQRLITDESRHRLNGDRIDGFGEVELSRLQHFYSLQGITESALGEVDNCLGIVINQHLNIIDMIYLGMS